MNRRKFLRIGSASLLGSVGCAEPGSPCNKCKGKGKQVCYQCNGEGQILFDNPRFSERRPCSVCAGTGQLKCTTCNGTGRLPQAAT